MIIIALGSQAPPGLKILWTLLLLPRVLASTETSWDTSTSPTRLLFIAALGPKISHPDPFQGAPCRESSFYDSPRAQIADATARSCASHRAVNLNTARIVITIVPTTLYELSTLLRYIQNLLGHSSFVLFPQGFNTFLVPNVGTFNIFLVYRPLST